jgi:SHS2 domain-containing protein
MPYRFLENVAVADTAFEATGRTLSEMFESAALAVTRTMVKNVDSVEKKVKKEFSVKAEDIEMLLFKFLQEVIYYKDARRLLFSKFLVKFNNERKNLTCIAEGEELDMNKHRLIVDVKAVTLHRFEVEKTKEGWRCQVILDI